MANIDKAVEQEALRDFFSHLCGARHRAAQHKHHWRGLALPLNFTVCVTAQESMMQT